MPDASRQRVEQIPGHARHPVEERGEVSPPDDEEAEGCLRDDGRGTRLAIEQAHLAEVISPAQPEPLPVRDMNARRSLDDQEELLPRLASANDDRVRRGVEDLGDAGE